MAAPGSSPIAIALEGVNGAGQVRRRAAGGYAAGFRESQRSDLSPGRPPQIEIHGQLTAVEISGASGLTADDTRRIAADLIGTTNKL